MEIMFEKRNVKLICTGGDARGRCETSCKRGGAQQQLAKLQLQLEQLHDSVAVVTRGREEADQGLIDITAKSDALLHGYLDRTQQTVKIDENR